MSTSDSRSKLRVISHVYLVYASRIETITSFSSIRLYRIHTHVSYRDIVHGSFGNLTVLFGQIVKNRTSPISWRHRVNYVIRRNGSRVENVFRDETWDIMYRIKFIFSVRYHNFMVIAQCFVPWWVKWTSRMMSNFFYTCLTSVISH